MPKAKRTPLSKKVRFDVFKRDSFTCQYCGAEAPSAVLHVDHILPVAEGGENTLTNLVTACSACNLGKGARKLNDDSAITRQKQQLNELNERREQLEMLQNWHSGLTELADQEVDAAHDYWRSVIGIGLSEVGIKKLKRYLKKYGYQKVVAGIDASVDRNCEYDESGDTTKDSAELAFNNLEKSIKFVSLPEEDKKIRYINGIARNRINISYRDQEHLKAALKTHARAGYSLAAAEEYAKDLNYKSEFAGFIDWLEKVEPVNG